MFRATSCSLSGKSIATLCGWPFRVQVFPDLHTRRSPTQWHIPDVVLIQLILLMMSIKNHNKMHVQRMYVRTYMYVLMYEHMYVFRVLLTINIYYFPIQYSMIFFVMCKDDFLCAVETEVCRLFVAAETQIYLNKYFKVFFPSLKHLFINKYFLSVGKA
jgi:hypothetical protein